jgi:putative membrane protein
MKWTTVVMIGSLAFAGMACENDGETVNPKWSETDRAFAAEANEANRAGIDFGLLAVAEADHDVVKVYGQTLNTEYTNALDNLQSLADDVDMHFSTEMNREHQILKGRLLGLSGIEFDTAYIKSQIVLREKTIALLETQIATGTNQTLIGYSTQLLPIARKHKEYAEQVYKQIVVVED